MVVETQVYQRMVTEAFSNEAHIFCLLMFLQVSAIYEFFFNFYRILCLGWYQNRGSNDEICLG